MASSAALVSTYQYTYGAGNSPNRQIQFYGDGQKVWGLVQGKSKNRLEEIGNINESQMFLEMASTSQKIEIMMQARANSIKPDYPSDKNLEALLYEERLAVIRQLNPRGKYRVTMSNDIRSNPRFEMVTRLTFFDPN